MSGKTKIFVLHMKEVIYTGIFIFLGLIFLILLGIMFLPKHDNGASSESKPTHSAAESTDADTELGHYTPGIYSAVLEVSGNSMELQVIIEQDGITDLSFIHMDETIETMYPLFPPVLENIAEQLKSGVTLKHVAYEDSQKYTAAILLEALEAILEKAAE